MNTILLTKVELSQGLAHPTGIGRNGKLGNMDIAVEQLAFVERALLAVHLCCNVATAQVQDEETFQADTTLLDGARHYNQ